MSEDTIHVDVEADEVSLKLPPLLVPIYKGDRLLRLAELPDPRESFINHFNQCGVEFGLRAELH